MKKYAFIIILLSLTLLFQIYHLKEGATKNYVRLPDDAYYYYQIGRNIATGVGATFDGENPANGYHPFWMGFVVATYYFFPANPVLPIIILRIIEVLLFLGSIFLLWKILQKITSNKWLIGILLTLYAFNPFNIRWINDGLETSLVLFMWLLFAAVFIRLLDPSTSSGHSKKLYALLGVVGGLMTLGRIDYGIFAAGAFIYLAVARRKNLRDWFYKMLILGGIYIATIAPWFMYNLIKFDSLLPASGLSYTLINRDWFFSKARTTIDVILWSFYQFAQHIIRIITSVGVPLPNISTTPVPTLIESLVIAALAIGIFWQFVWKKRKEEFKNAFYKNSAGIAWIVLAAAFVIFAFAQAGYRWSARPWYFISAPVLFIWLAALMLEKIWPIRTLSRTKAVSLAVLVIIAFLLNAYWYEGMKNNITRNYLSKEPIETMKYEAAQWMNANLPPDARIASFNGGAIGYYTKRFVMNADGRVNNAVYEAMKANKPLWELFKEKNIQYIADGESTVADARIIWLGVKDPLKHLENVVTYPNQWNQRIHYDVYKIKYYEPYEIHDHPRYKKKISNL